MGFGNHTHNTHKFMRSVRKTKTMGRDASRWLGIVTIVKVLSYGYNFLNN